MYSSAKINGTVESRMGAVAWAMWQRAVSHPRSSNRTCRSPASGSPTGFIARRTEKKPWPQASCVQQLPLLRLTIQLSLKGPDDPSPRSQSQDTTVQKASQHTAFCVSCELG